jgi:hypothetical protein
VASSGYEVHVSLASWLSTYFYSSFLFCVSLTLRVTFPMVPYLPTTRPVATTPTTPSVAVRATRVSPTASVRLRARSCRRLERRNLCVEDVQTRRGEVGVARRFASRRGSTMWEEGRELQSVQTRIGTYTGVSTRITRVLIAMQELICCFSQVCSST